MLIRPLPLERKGQTVLSFSLISEGRESTKRAKKNFSVVQREKKRDKTQIHQALHYVCIYNFNLNSALLFEKPSFGSVVMNQLRAQPN